MSDETKHILELIAIHEKRLRILEIHAAKDPHNIKTLTDIQTTNEEIEKLKGKLPSVNPSESVNPMPDSPQKQNKEILLTLRFFLNGNNARIIWESDVIGRRESMFTLPYDETQLPLVIKALDAVQWPGHPRQGPQFDPEEIEKLVALKLWQGNRVAIDIDRHVGQTLYQAITSDSEGAAALSTVRDYAAAQNISVSYIFRFPAEAIELSVLPWELLWDERSAVLLSRGRLASCARYLDLDQAIPPLVQPGSRLNILAIAPDAHIPADIRNHERAARNTAWSELVKDGLVQLEELHPVTPETLLDRIQTGTNVDVIHFYGHGRYKDGKGALLFDSPDGGIIWVSADKLATLLGNMRLIVLHACQSAMTGEQEIATGVASALSAAGVPAVVAMNFTVRISAATRFAAVLYRSLANGNSLQQSVNLARQALYFASSEDDKSWFVPTLTVRSRDTGPFYLMRKQ
jgi:hypothetical protein